MIDGLKLEMTSDELREHIGRRAAYHRERLTFYEGQIVALRQGGVEQSTATNNPIQSLAESAKGHRSKVELFEFMQQHVVPNETYRLSESDLGRLEILSRW